MSSALPFLHHVIESTHVKCIFHTHFSGEGTEAQMASTPAQNLLRIRSELRLTTKLLWELLTLRPILSVGPTLLLDRQTGPGVVGRCCSSVRASELWDRA